MPAEQDAVEPERVEEAEQVGRVVVHRVAVVGRVAQAAAAEVDREHAERGREPGGGEPVEEVRVRREAVGQDERRPVAAVVEQVEANPVRLDEPALAHDAPSSAPADDARRPRVAGAGGEQQHELAVVQLAGARGAVEREQRVDAAHVPGVVEIRGARSVEPELGDERAVHRRLHVDAAEIADVRERRAAALDGALGPPRRSSRG